MPEKQMTWIGGSTRLVAIFGWPLSYTLSPRFQNTAIRLGGVDARYMALPAPDEASFLALARGLMGSPHFVGANVTNPYKISALKLVKRLGPAAKAIGAVNTLRRDGKSWVGENTDAEGFARTLASVGVQLKGRRVIILGAGGAARACAWAAGQAKADRVLVLARRGAQAKATAKLAGRAGLSGDLDPALLGLASAAADLVVNTLPGADLGRLYGQALLRRPRAGCAVMDISYVPRDTAFLKAAHARGWLCIDGLGMLLEQGRAAFQFWFKKKADLTSLRRSVQ
ncbi:MAG TPA: shikimate dehydrogenase [bacterium]|nr:shikimate dehydrogenase [bacterium]